MKRSLHIVLSLILTAGLCGSAFARQERGHIPLKIADEQEVISDGDEDATDGDEDATDGDEDATDDDEDATDDDEDATDDDEEVADKQMGKTVDEQKKTVDEQKEKIVDERKSADEPIRKSVDELKGKSTPQEREKNIVGEQKEKSADGEDSDDEGDSDDEEEAVIELAAKYDARIKESSAEEERVALLFLAVMEKVLEKSEKDGSEAIPPEDLEQLALLHEALGEELARYDGYLQRRGEIEKMLAKPEEPQLLYKFGVAGFLRGEGAGNFSLRDFDFQPGHGEGRFLYRVKPYLYWHPTDWLDLHAEGQGYGFSGGAHEELNKVSLYQGFAEVRLPGSNLLALKAGRQEFNYGSAFILGPDSFFDGLSFDAVRLRINPVEPLDVDLLAGSYATPFSAGVEGNLAGAYATWTFSEDNALEAYVFRDSGSAAHHAGEYLAIWGLRGTASLGPFSLEFEPVYESGRAFNSVGGGNGRIDAFGGHFDVSAESTLAGHANEFFASYAYGSGGQNAVSGTTSAREFNNHDNDSSLMGDMSVVIDLSGVTVDGHHASGLQIYTLGWGIDITENANFSATGHYFLANDVESGFSKHLGLETDFTLTYTVNDGLSFIAGYDRFFTGGFFRDASGSGKDIDYGYFMVQFDISKSKLKLKPVTMKP